MHKVNDPLIYIIDYYEELRIIWSDRFIGHIGNRGRK